MDVPGDPFADGPAALAVESDAAIVVRDGVIIARGRRTPTWPARTPSEEVVDLRAGCCCPA